MTAPPTAAEQAREYADTETGGTDGFADTPQGIACRAFLAGAAAEREACARILDERAARHRAGATKYLTVNGVSFVILDSLAEEARRMAAAIRERDR